MGPKSDAVRRGLRHSYRVTQASVPATVRRQARRWAGRMVLPSDVRGVRVAVLAGMAALVAYLLPILLAPAAHWPLWDVRVYWWGGRQAAAGGRALYAPGAPFSFTYPPFAAALFAVFAGAPAGVLKAVLTAGSLAALPVLCGLSLGAAGVQRRPETVFAVSAAALLTWPVAYTLHLGEIDLILTALIGTDLLARRDGAWWQGIGTGLAAGIKLTPLIFVAYLALTGRLRAAVTAAGVFAATLAAGFIWLPGQSRVFWLGGVFYSQNRIGDPANPSDQSLAGAVARLAGTGDPPRAWWLVAALAVGLAGAGRRRLGAPPRAPAGRLRVLRRHRAAGLADLLDPPLDLGRPAAGVADHGRLAAPVLAVRPGRGGGRRHLLRIPRDPVARSPAQPRADGRQRPVRAVWPGSAGRHRTGSGQGTRGGLPRWPQSGD